MLKLIALSATVVIGAAHAAGAASLSVAPPVADPSIIQVGEFCGGHYWRSGLDNRCRPLGAYVSNPGTPIECPASWHIGPRGGACWPNR